MIGVQIRVGAHIAGATVPVWAMVHALSELQRSTLKTSQPLDCCYACIHTIRGHLEDPRAPWGMVGELGDCGAVTHILPLRKRGVGGIPRHLSLSPSLSLPLTHLVLSSLLRPVIAMQPWQQRRQHRHRWRQQRLAI